MIKLISIVQKIPMFPSVKVFSVSLTEVSCSLPCLGNRGMGSSHFSKSERFHGDLMMKKLARSLRAGFRRDEHCPICLHQVLQIQTIVPEEYSCD
jgi:hypothetical protein